LTRKPVSERTIRRLSHYSRCLRLAKSRGESVMTSNRLAAACTISSAAVRKDLSSFGEFGRKGSGYDVDGLLASIEDILGVADPPGVVIVGAGNMGRALIASGLSGSSGYRVRAVFDSDPAMIGREIGGLRVEPVDALSRILRELGEVIAVLAVGRGGGQAALDRVAAAGCRAVLSFNLEPMKVPEGVCLRFVEVSTELDILTHALRSPR